MWLCCTAPKNWPWEGGRSGTGAGSVLHPRISCHGLQLLEDLHHFWVAVSTLPFSSWLRWGMPRCSGMQSSPDRARRQFLGRRDMDLLGQAERGSSIPSTPTWGAPGTSPSCPQLGWGWRAVQGESWWFLLLKAPGEGPAPAVAAAAGHRSPPGDPRPPPASTEKPPALKQSHTHSTSHTQDSGQVTKAPGSDTTSKPP